MRLRKLFTAVMLTTLGLAGVGIPAPANAAGGGNVSIWWDFNGGPSTVNDLTFPITIGTDTAHWDGTYFAQQFNFSGTGPVGYTGLQPMADRADGTTQMRALFSSFDDTSTSSHPNCSDGADGGGGTTCRVVINGTYGHTFHMQITRIATDTWEGKVIDTTTGDTTSVGSWNVPGSGSLRTWQGGFVEYYASVPSCSELPRVNVTFGAPFTSSGASGRSGTNGEYSDCVGQTTYQATQVGNGINIIRGTVHHFRLKNDASSRCLDNYSHSDTTPALYDCNGGGNQAWYSTDWGGLKNNGVCLDARNAALVVGTPVDLYPCHSGSNQQWRINANGTITGVGSGLCLAVVANSAANGARLELNSCTAPSAQWTKVG